jgi:type IV pilus assembly protein PilB
MPAESSNTILQKKLAVIRRSAEERDAERRGTTSGFPYADLSKVPVSTEALKLVPEATARAARLAPIEIKVTDVAVAAFDGNSPEAKAVCDALRAKRYNVKVFTVSLSGLDEAWRLYKFVGGDAKDITGAVAIEKQRFEKLLSQLTTFKAVEAELTSVDFHTISTTNLFEIVLAGAMANRASDIHFEAEEGHARVRYRLDGLLHDIFKELPEHNYATLLSRIKLLSGLKINVYGEPQDGRFTIDLPNKEVEMRVSIVPSEFGETIVMRVLDPDAISVELGTLGLRADILELAKRELKRPNGLILNTGPTGSGKTTTLYAFLKAILDPELKIITIEDPIEYRIVGIEQTQVHPDAGYTFAGGLRAMLRQDPDVILVGEIRDKETADMAMQASLTGHLVLSTLHANDAVSSIPRLRDLGEAPETIGPSLTLIIAQRLVRILCKTCKKAVTEPSAAQKAGVEKLLASLPAAVDRKPYEKWMLYEAVGCPDCNGLGYRGRKGIFEFLEVTPALQELILKQTSEPSIRKLAREQGLVTFQEDGILKALTGETSLDEVEKITGPIDW